MRYLLLAATAALMVFMACKGESGKELVTPSGTRYIKHVDTGSPKPKAGDWVYFHAQLRNGDEVVNSSRQMGAEPSFQLGSDLTPGAPPNPIEEVLMDMGVGDSVTIFIPLDTLPQKPPGFENADMMYYDMVLLNIKSSGEYQQEQDEKRKIQEEQAADAVGRAAEVIAATQAIAKDYTAGNMEGKLQQSNTGLKYLILEEGTGKQAEGGKLVSVNYVGVLTDGTVFDNSFERGPAIEFPLQTGRVIPGWDEGIGYLKEGSKAYLFIPYPLAYGEAGSPPVIPEKAELIFYVELVKAD